jgi:uncharacterized protein (TIGR00255 family)
MTGFGDASAQRDGLHLAVELRSVNNRYFKAVLRLPEELTGLEPELESRLRRRVSRGSLALTISFKDTSASAAQEINEAALRRYLEHLEHVEREALAGGGAPRQVTIDLAGLLSLPGVVQAPTSRDLLDRIGPMVRDLVDQACERMLTMRESEGRALVEDLLRHRLYIQDRLEQIALRAPRVVEEYHERLCARVQELLSRAQLKLAEQDLAREVAIYAERCDIAEELNRLATHLEQLSAILTQPTGDPAGRTLDFLAQELLREANTIASKSNDSAIAKVIVEIKGAIDRIKEQVQNIE